MQKIFLVAILVSVCAAKCTNGIIGTIGSVPCPIITPGFGTPGLGGGAGGFPGLNGEYISKSFHLKFRLFEEKKNNEIIPFYGKICKNIWKHNFHNFSATNFL